jgi:hypothetical protein
MSEFSAEEKQAAAERELARRRRVYPNRMLTHRMRQREADREIAIMAAIVRDYAAAAEKENLL